MSTSTANNNNKKSSTKNETMAVPLISANTMGSNASRSRGFILPFGAASFVSCVQTAGFCLSLYLWLVPVALLLFSQMPSMRADPQFAVST